MNIKALVVDDDPAVQETVSDILDSLGHSYDQATSLEEARGLLAAGTYNYILLDLEIPVRTGRGLPRIQNGENLLAQIVEQQDRVPVIVMTGHGRDSPELAVRIMKSGAVDFVRKPFPTCGDTLDRAIREAMNRSKRNAGGKDRRVGRRSRPRQRSTPRGECSS